MSLNLNLGRVLEQKFHKRLKCIKSIKNIYTEHDLCILHGWNASSIDFIVELDDKLIFIQTKWRGSRRRENHFVNNFIKSYNYLHTKYNTQVYGMWVSRMQPFEDNEQLMKTLGINTIHYYDSMDGLIEKAVGTIIELGNSQ